MASKNFKLRRNSLYELRSEPGVRAELERRGQAILDAVGGEAAGYMMSSSQGARKPQGRWRVAVFTATWEAMHDNAKNNTLITNFGVAHD
ncbi:hypothetical protein [Nocardia wallacei]|uniref:hypothetical protein n=1 Tax=Nocardia wallacei TaxID=480035 RepID=UPI002457FB2F|nr:hypothetical protein [Nocardia wallacei]